MTDQQIQSAADAHVRKQGEGQQMTSADELICAEDFKAGAKWANERTPEVSEDVEQRAVKASGQAYENGTLDYEYSKPAGARIAIARSIYEDGYLAGATESARRMHDLEQAVKDLMNKCAAYESELEKADEKCRSAFRAGRGYPYAGSNGRNETAYMYDTYSDWERVYDNAKIESEE